MVAGGWVSGNQKGAGCVSEVNKRPTVCGNILNGDELCYSRIQ
jgi:hypothetical protein